jgi:quercetin dioxygenase-like cupin family protein
VLAEVPGALTYDQAISSQAIPLKVVDWRREPVLASEHDARKRIYIATPKLFGTHAVKGEIIIYPPGTAAAEHHHVGADHFMFFLKGRGTTYAEGRPIPVREGDLVYYPDLEKHWLQADPDSEMMFAEFFVPGVFETVWVQEAIACTWNPTGKDIAGDAPVRDIARHRHGSPDVEI